MEKDVRKQAESRTRPIKVFGIPRSAKVWPPQGRRRKHSCLPREPTDFSDEGLMEEYLAGLRKFFRLD
jgi:hypothetical protein